MQFSTGNFLSIKDMVTFSMERTNIKELETTNVLKTGRRNDLLRTAAIYGANASGKTNLLIAMDRMKDLVINSSKNSQASERLGVTPFLLSNETDKMPTTFEMVFITDNTQYRYGFSADENRVHEEWLYHTKNVRETQLFVREGQRIELSVTFKEGKGLETRTRENALFLSVCAQFNGTLSNRIMKWYRSLHVFGDNDRRTSSIRHLRNPELKNKLVNFIKSHDIFIEDILTEQHSIQEMLPPDMPDALRDFLDSDDVKEVNVTNVSFLHQKFDVDWKAIGLEELSANMESAGTLRLFGLAGPILDALSKGYILVIDELESHLHPHITKRLVELFQSSMNQSGAQLIFTTHSAELLDGELFRRDQIWFTEKDNYGCTKLYSLVEYKIRKDYSIRKNYLLGRFGGVPILDHNFTED